MPCRADRAARLSINGVRRSIDGQERAGDYGTLPVSLNVHTPHNKDSEETRFDPHNVQSEKDRVKHVTDIEGHERDGPSS